MVNIHFSFSNLNFLFPVLAEDIATALSSPGLRGSELYADADLEDELELLAQEESNKEMLRIGPLPDVPATTKTKQPDAVLRELEAWAI
jgi:hypothetical protein